MTPRERARLCSSLIAGVLCATACHPAGSELPWSGSVPALGAARTDVRTLNADYERARSHVLAREVDRPTRASMDYAAYHANFMIDEAEPEAAPAAGTSAKLDQPFAGTVERASMTGDIQKTALSASERGTALAFAPLLEFVLAKKTAGGTALEQLASSVRSERWGQAGVAGVPSQTIAEAFIHRTTTGASELWVKIEFAPWFTALGKLPDQDRDGFPELYARARQGSLSPEVAELIARDYSGHVFDAHEIKAWANQLSSYWYPSYNTDLVVTGASWPDDHTEAEIKQELRAQSFTSPTIVMRGKPQGTATYNLFFVKGLSGAELAAAAGAKSTGASLVLPATTPTPDPKATGDVIRHELETLGDGAWDAWAKKLAPFTAAVRHRLASSPRSIKAFAANDGFLFFRNSLEYTTSGDLERQPAGKNPLPVIVEFKRTLEALGVDFLFVPVPAKEEIFPDELDAKFQPLAGQVVAPFGRKLLLALSEQGVEVVDLLTPFLAARRADLGGSDSGEPIYQHQDTHWTARGLELAAETLAARIKRYPWYPELARHARRFSVKDTSFTRLGDLHSRLPEAAKAKYQPETLVAHQVLSAEGQPYEDDPESPLVVLGDSFTGVYELTDAEHAGLSAHLARALSYPTDLVMSYGGGPNVRNTLMRRGTDALKQKKLVVWVMADRDLYHYWENWEPLKQP